MVLVTCTVVTVDRRFTPAVAVPLLLLAGLVEGQDRTWRGQVTDGEGMDHVPGESQRLTAETVPRTDLSPDDNGPFPT